MFNLKSHNTIDDKDLLRSELKIFDITKDPNGYDIIIGDEAVVVKSMSECLELISTALKEIKEHSFECWENLSEFSERIVGSSGQNRGNLDNLLFLHAVKKSISLSSMFSELEPVTQKLKLILDVDIAGVDEHLIKHFNSTYFRIIALHKLIIRELYRQKLIRRYMSLTKQAQISGPWANLDLPMKERVWEWEGEDEEYFDNRTRSRREQIRYNPENATSEGFYYIWQDLNRSPYLFKDKKEDSPYQSRELLTIP